MITIDHIHTTLIKEKKIKYALVLPSNCQKTLFWLHGYQERSEQLLKNFDFEKLADQYRTAIVFPDVPDTYYFNQPWNECYTEDFLVSEFMPSITKRHNLPTGRANTFLAGISMGGFGSLLIGSHYPERFAKIACISGAFIIDDLLIGNPEVTSSAANLFHFQKLFGDIPSLADDPKRNPFLAAQETVLAAKLTVNPAAKSPAKLPPIYLTCGTEDLLYTRNQKIYHQLTSTGPDITWQDASGDHDWNFFEPAIFRVIKWFSN